MIRTRVLAACCLTLLALAASILAAPSARAAAYTRYPWVNLVTQNSVVIAWQTDVPTTGEVRYSDDLSYGFSATHPGTATDHAVEITSLADDNYYFYQVISGTDTLTLDNNVFHTRPVADYPFSFLAFGDLGRATPAQIALAARADTLVAEFGILTGDIIYEAGEAANFTPQYFDIYRPTIARIPFYTALGNHDEGTNGGQPYLDAFYLPSNNPATTERYYSFDYGNAHFVCLEVVNENTTPDAAMLTWLDQDLQASPAYWKFVYFHVPAYSNSGGHGGDATIAAALEPIFINRGVDVVFQGHNHFYTRTYPLNAGAPQNQSDEPNYVNPNGPVWITTGGGGRALYAITTPLSSIEANSASKYHLVYCTVVDNVLYLFAIDENGIPFDGATITKTATTAIALADLEATGDADAVTLRWRRVDGGTDGGFHVERAAAAGGPWTRLTPALLTGGPAFEFADRSAEPGVTYDYRLAIVDGRGRESYSGPVAGSRTGAFRFALGRARPNPARGGTSFTVTLERAAATRAVVVDVRGRLVRTLASRAMPAGTHVLAWDGRDDRGARAPAGIYFAVVRSGDHEARTRVALLR